MKTSIMKRAAFGLFLAVLAAPAWALSVSLSAPANNAVFQAGATVTLSATATPTTGRPITKVEFFRGGTTLIGTDTTSPYSFSWTNVPAGSYTITAKATDSTGATATSTSRAIKVNAPPAVTLTAPANGAFFNPGSTISLTATATDSDGTISKVEFLRGGTTLIGSDTTSPYSFNWTNVAAGSYTLTARATDSNSGVTTSTAVNIVVDTAPTVSLTAPANNAVFLPGAAVTVTANAADADGTVAKVEFFDGATLAATVTAAPFTANLTGLASGTHSLTAKATDNLGRATTSAAVSIRVDAAPTVSITAPANGTVFNAPASFTITATAADSDGTVSKVEFFEGATLLGTATAAPYSVSLANVASGTHAYTAKATDNNGAATTSSAVSVIVNSPPTVSITSPAAGAVFTAPANFSITATASDPDGTVAKVDFFEVCLTGPDCIGGRRALGTVTVPPYSVSLTNVAAGGHTYGAVATDNSGGTTTSAQVSVTVNVPPTVSITSPANNAVFNAPASITITASASDSDGTISKVEFFEGATLLGTSTAAPYSVSLTNVAAGTHAYTAKATDNNGGATTSAAVSVVVNALPSVSITSPPSGAVFTAPGTLILEAAASDTDGTIAKVDFFQGATLLGTATAAPYRFTWSNVPAGVYSVTAVATDDRGATTTSAAITVIIDIPPTVSITSPANNAVFTEPASVNITANAADADGTVTKVDFYLGSPPQVLLGTSTAAPYSFSWTNVPRGSYALTAVATDDRGVTTNSAAVVVTVNAPPTVSITSPADGAVFAAPATITVTANPSDPEGAVSKVDFYQGTTLIGTATAFPYSISWANVASGAYALTAVATDGAGATTASAVVNVRVNTAPTVSISQPATGANFGAPANITIAADAFDTDGTITSVAFYQNGTLISTVTTAPYVITWTGVPQGSYSLTAVATDDAGGTATSTAVAVTVGPHVAQMYFIYPDHLNTPRAVSDASGTVVWSWDHTESFGSAPPNDNPSGLGAFDFPLRLPGQYFDRETGIAYNGFRDYDAGIARYIESDPVGLRTGVKNLYAYAKSDPLRNIDPAGLLEAPPVEIPPVRPPVTPPAAPGGPDCVNIPPWSILVSSGGIFGFMRNVTVICSYYCQPSFCPANPNDYVFTKIFYDQLQVAPWLSPCPPRWPRSEFL